MKQYQLEMSKIDTHQKPDRATVVSVQNHVYEYDSVGKKVLNQLKSKLSFSGFF